MPPDFGAGFFEGLGQEQREARLRLLNRLHGEGCTVEELEAAAASGRLAIVGVERLLGRDRRYSLDDAGELTGLPEAFLRRNQLALGLPLPEPGEPVYEEDHIENLRVLGGLLEAGFEEEDLLQMTRVLGHSLRRVADTFLDGLSTSLVQPGDGESEIADRYTAFAEAMLPQLDRLVGAVLRLHLLDAVREDAIVQIEHAAGRLTGAREVAVAFADLTGFTAFSDHTGVEEVGALAGRFEAAAAEAVCAPARLVKVLGDGAMYVGDDASAVMDTVLTLMTASTDRGLPAVHAGVAYGPALRGTGDWFGRTVNLASRLCDAASPGTALLSGELVEAAGERAAGAARRTSLHLRGFDAPITAFGVVPG